jgi:hypothetical protein
MALVVSVTEFPEHMAPELFTPVTDSEILHSSLISTLPFPEISGLVTKPVEPNAIVVPLVTPPI